VVPRKRTAAASRSAAPLLAPFAIACTSASSVPRRLMLSEA
jgi:hypothetical protein